MDEDRGVRVFSRLTTAQDGSFYDARQTTSALAGTLWHPLAPSRLFELFMHSHPIQPMASSGVHWKDWLRPKNPRDPSLANPFSAPFYTEARHARSAPVPSEESTMSPEGNGRPRYGNGSMKWQCHAWHGWWRQ